ncbi:hypothetical protein SEVIR_9G111450v4 [Setaria viridis]
MLIFQRFVCIMLLASNTAKFYLDLRMYGDTLHGSMEPLNKNYTCRVSNTGNIPLLFHSHFTALRF